MQTNCFRKTFSVRHRATDTSIVRLLLPYIIGISCFADSATDFIVFVALPCCMGVLPPIPMYGILGDDGMLRYVLEDAPPKSSRLIAVGRSKWRFLCARATFIEPRLLESTENIKSSAFAGQ